MVLLELTPALSARLISLHSALPAELAQLVQQALDVDTPPVLDPSSTAEDENATAQSKTISHEILVKVSLWARNHPTTQYSLSSLLRLTTIHAPPLAPRYRSPELLAILSSLSLAADRASYDRMTAISAPSFVSSLPMTDYAGGEQSAKSIAEEWTEVRRQLSAVVNVLVSMATVGTGVWWVGGGRSVQARLGLSMLGAVAIAAIEAWLYWRFFNREQGGDVAAKGKGGKQGRPRTGAVLRFETAPILASAEKKVQ